MELQKRKKEQKKSSTKKNIPVAHAIGRRKSAVARIWVRKGSGKIVVNGKEYTEYFDTDVNRIEVAKPFSIIPIALGYDIEADVTGGGHTGQAGAVQLGIARALLALDETIRPVLRQHDLLTVDSRVKERKKYGQKAARRKFQFVKR